MKAPKTQQMIDYLLRTTLVGTLALSAASVAPAQSAKAKGDAGEPASVKGRAAKSSGGQHEGIKVHGDWIIVIRNADGSVASRHEFKNGLADVGLLPLLLNHGGSVGRWEVRLSGAGTQPCTGTVLGNPILIPCILLETGNAGALGELQVSATAAALELRGFIRADRATQIANVSTLFQVCPPTSQPSANCFSPNGVSAFTGKDVLGLNINVGANQTIDVTVVISFS